MEEERIAEKLEEEIGRKMEEEKQLKNWKKKNS